MKKILFFLVISTLILVATACGSNTNTNETSSSDSNTLIGDWAYEGTIDNVKYEINLDLEKDATFTLEVDKDSTDETIDSEAKGTYTYDDEKLTLSIITVQDINGYFDNPVVENGQLEFNYKLTNSSLELENIAQTVKFLPDDITLTKDF